MIGYSKRRIEKDGRLAFLCHFAETENVSFVFIRSSTDTITSARTVFVKQRKKAKINRLETLDNVK